MGGVEELLIRQMSPSPFGIMNVIGFTPPRRIEQQIWGGGSSPPSLAIGVSVSPL